MNNHKLLSTLILFTLAHLTTLALANTPSPSLQQQFANPPSSFRPLIITHGYQLNNPNLPNYLNQRHAGGSVIDVQLPGIKGPEHFINPKYLNDPVAFKNLRTTMANFKKNNLDVWIYDELGYPSGSAGGHVLDGHPEFAAQAIRCRTFKATPQPQTITPQGRLILSYAFPLKNKPNKSFNAIDFTQQARSGQFTWQAPDNDWILCLYEQITPDTWKRHNINRRNVNIMDARAVARFIDITHQKYADELGPQLSDAYMFFTDEPQLSVVEPWMPNALPDTPPAVPYCDELPAKFESIKGYPLTKALPALFLNIGPATARYRYDFYDVTSQLIADNYYGQLETFCHNHNIASSGHMLLEESLLFHPMFSGSMLRNWSHQDLPGIDQLVLSPYKTMAGWEGGSKYPVHEDFSIKLAASIAALKNKQGVFSESFALINRANLKDTLQAAKGMAAWQFTSGVTHMCTYGLQDKLTADQYAQFADFTGRIALMSRRGQSISDVAVFVPESSVWAFYNPPTGGTFKRYIDANPDVMQIDYAFRQTCHQLLNHQRDFEALSEDLLAQAKIKGDHLEINNHQFAFLILPECRMLTKKSLEKITAFAQSGGRIIFTGTLPYLSANKRNSGVTSLAIQIKKLVKTYPSRIRFIADQSQFDETINWMATQIPPQITWDGPQTLRIAHQQEPNRNFLILANPNSTAIQGSLTTKLPGQPTLWNPETGQTTPIPNHSQNKPIDLTIPQNSARIIVLE